MDAFEDIIVRGTPEVPGMIDAAEGRYLYWLTSEVFSGQGGVVEIGCWLGRSTVHLAAGLRRRGLNVRLHCFDHFRWASGWNIHAPIKKRSGADFLQEFLDNTEAFRDLIKVHQTKIRDLSWGGGPVEILFLDAPKRLNDISKVLSVFASSMIPGVTIVAFQDFLHAPSFEIPATLSHIWSRLEPLHVVSTGNLVAFRVRAPWTREDVTSRQLSFENWTPEQARAIWERWDVVVPDKKKQSFQLGLAMLLHDIGKLDAMRSVVRTIAEDTTVLTRAQGWANTSLYMRYQPVFSALCIAPSRS